MALKTSDLAPNDQGHLAAIKGQMEANRKGHDDYVTARDSGDQAGMDTNKPSFIAFEQYAQQYRDEAGNLGVSGEPDDNDIPAAVTSPSERNVGKVPSKPDKGVSPADLNPGGPPVETK